MSAPDFGVGQDFVPAKAALGDGPQVKSGKFAAPTRFAAESAKIDACWLAHQTIGAATSAKG